MPVSLIRKWQVACVAKTFGTGGYSVDTNDDHDDDTDLPSDSTVLAVLPTTIDTPMNRQFMADADFSTWTSTEEIADKLYGWSDGTDALPASGTLVVMETEDSKTKWVNAN